MRLGHTFSRNSSPCPLSIQRSVVIETPPRVGPADADRGDWVLCQITSQSYADPNAIKITPTDMAGGSLARTSYIRPAKLFTANSGIMVSEIGQVSAAKMDEVRQALLTLFQ